MSAVAVPATVFASLAVAVLLGLTLSARLARHLSSDSRDTVKLTLGLVATLAALLLSLLVSSAKQSFDANREQVNALAAKIATLDRVLALFGEETTDARAELRAVVERAITQAWPSRRGASSDLTVDPRQGEAIFHAIQQLQPTDALQTELKNRATSLAFELIEGRSMMVALAKGQLSMPLLTLVLAWLVVILFGFSLLAPRNGVAVAALIVSAAAVCGAVLLLLELYGPFNGLIQISSDPLLTALGEPRSRP